METATKTLWATLLAVASDTLAATGIENADAAVIVVVSKVLQYLANSDAAVATELLARLRPLGWDRELDATILAALA